MEIQRFIALGAMGLEKQNAPLMLYTHYQTKGVGQRGSDWVSEFGMNLLMTVAFPLQKNKEYPWVEINKSLATSVAVQLSELIESHVEIKWPNDIIYNHLKLGGLLLETTQIGQKKYLLMGLGINVMQRDFPVSIMATSLWLAKYGVAGSSTDLGSNSGLGNVDSLVAPMFEKLLITWKNPIQDSRRYDQYLYRKGQWVALLDVKLDRVFQAKLLEVNAMGQITVQLETGEMAAYHHGEVRMLYRNKSNN